MWIKLEDKTYPRVGEDTCFPYELPEKIAAAFHSLIIVEQISNIFHYRN